MKNPFFCFDLDGTITRKEILPIIARQLDIEQEISDLTFKTINGLIPFEESFQVRTQLLRGVSTREIHLAIAEIPLFEKIANFIRQNSEHCAVITGNIDLWVKPILDSLGCRVFTSKGIFKGDAFDKATIILEKGKVVDELRLEGKKTIVAIGDGMGDVSLFLKSNLSIAFGGVHEPVHSLIQVSDMVTYDEGGLCQFLRSQL